MTGAVKRPAASLRLCVDGYALAANWRLLDQWSGTAAAGAAIKADCYGLGVDNCLPVLLAAGARDFFVAHWSEVEAALTHIAPDQLSVLHGPVTAADAAFARESAVRPVVNSVEQARRWTESGGGMCDLMVDTGINRLGIALEDAGDPTIAALKVHTLHSHLACADEDSPANARQLERFRAAVAAIPHRRASLANSAGVALGADYAFDLTRPGLALYGGVPRPEYAGMIRPVASLEVAVLQRRRIAAGEGVGYNAAFVAPRAMDTAVVSLGYADGFLRAWGGHGSLRHGDRILPILGKVSMDMVVVDASAAPALREGDWVSVPYDLPAGAAATGLSQYELLTVLGNRFDPFSRSCETACAGAKQAVASR